MTGSYTWLQWQCQSVTGMVTDISILKERARTLSRPPVTFLRGYTCRRFRGSKKNRRPIIRTRAWTTIVTNNERRGFPPRNGKEIASTEINKMETVLTGTTERGIRGGNPRKKPGIYRRRNIYNRARYEYSARFILRARRFPYTRLARRSRVKG